MYRAVFSFLFIVLAFGLVFSVPSAHADTTADLNSQIEQINKQKAAIDAEIAQYQKQLTQIGAQKQTLQTAIKTLDVSRSQTQSQIASIQKKIQAANLELDALSIQITDKQKIISLDQQAVARALRFLQGENDTSLVEQLFAANDFADAWRAADNLTTITEALRAHTDALSQAKQELATQHDAVDTTKKVLTVSNADLGTQKQALDAQKVAKDSLLTQTKNQESSYQALIALKKSQEAAFEKVISDLQSQLKSVGAAAVPHSGSGVLSWPYSAAFLQSCAGKAGVLGNQFCITQYFGNTAFATANAQIYNGMGHDGIDIGMPVGTPVKAALAGTVLATGNTDVKAPDGRMCYSFGKWVMLQHANGLNTLYAHLSQISVSKGQELGTGDTLGLSGMTGYATGPHLHFGVYVGSGVQITDLARYRGSSGTPCTSAGVLLPLAPTDAYLNPMSYL